MSDRGPLEEDFDLEEAKSRFSKWALGAMAKVKPGLDLTMSMSIRAPDRDRARALAAAVAEAVEPMKSKLAGAGLHTHDVGIHRHPEMGLFVTLKISPRPVF